MRAHRLTAALAAAWMLVMAGPALSSELSGSGWQLVEIQSMDDTTYTPRFPGRYTLDFLEGGRAAIQADCNRATGRWTSEQSSQLRFGPIASTKALCPDGSISDRFLVQFEWVRSYIIRDQRLYLATMADGSIIEFQPIPPLAGRVGGETIRTRDTLELQAQVLNTLLDQYVQEKDINVSAAEIDAVTAGMARHGAADDDLTPEEAIAAKTMRGAMAAALIRHWKINKALFEEFGGRLVRQQLGPEPIDAYRQFLEQAEAQGRFEVYGDDRKAAFWRYFTEEAMHDFIPPGSDEERAAFAEPFWQ